MQDNFRSPIDPLAIFEQWWGEPLSPNLLDRAINAPLYQRQEFIVFASRAPRAEIPDIGRGTLRPMLVQDGFHFAGFEDYFSAAVALALYSNEVAVEYAFGRNPVHLEEMLRYLLVLKPLAETGAIRFFEPNTGMHQWGIVDDVWADITGGVGLSGVDWDKLERAIDEYGAPYGHSMTLEGLLLLVASQISSKSAAPEKFSLIARSEPELAVINAFARLSRSNPIDRRGYALSKLIGLRVPFYSFDTQNLVKLRLSESVFDEWRTSLRNALNDIEGLPDGTSQWQRAAQEIAEGELEALQSKIDRKTHASPFLAKAKAGVKAIALSAVGAGSAALLGADFKSGFVGAAATSGVQVASEYWQSVKRRNQLNAVKDVIMTFTTASR